MNLTALLWLLGLVATAWSCPTGCKPWTHGHRVDFQHVSELQHSSVAPWKLTEDTLYGRVPYSILTAACTKCSVEHMVAKPIRLNIFVYHVVHNNSLQHWCRCPYSLAVGCTCVKE